MAANYLRTGRLLPISYALPAANRRTLIVVGNQAEPRVRAFLAEVKQVQPGGQAGKPDVLGAGQYMLKTLDFDGGKVLLVADGDSIGTLYGAYRLAEHLGVRFYMHGDVVPDEQSMPGRRGLSCRPCAPASWRAKRSS